MLLSNIKPTIKVQDYLRVNENSVILLIPDTNVDIVTDIYKTGFLLSNCKGIISPIRIFTAGSKRFLTKVDYYDLKKRFVENPPSLGKKLRVLTPESVRQTTSKEEDNITENYYFYNGSILLKIFEYYLTKFPPKISSIKFLQEIEKIYNEIKSAFPNYKVYTMFLIKNNKNILSPFLANLRSALYHPDIRENIKISDKFTFVNLLDKSCYPLLDSSPGYSKLIIQNFGKILRELDLKDIEGEKEKELSNFNNIGQEKEPVQIAKLQQKDLFHDKGKDKDKDVKKITIIKSKDDTPIKEKVQSGKSLENIVQNIVKTVDISDTKKIVGENKLGILKISKERKNRIKIIEEKLNVKLPNDYANFISKFGYIQNDELGEVFGYDEKIEDINKIPCVIGATLLYREKYKLPNNFIVISINEDTEEITCIDTLSGRIYLISPSGKRSIIADSFKLWFNNQFLKKRISVAIYNSKLIEKVLKKNGIDDPDIAATITETLKKNTSEVSSRDDIEKNILRAVNFIINGTYNLTEDQVNNPDMLFNQLKYTNTFKVPLSFPKVKRTIDPNDVINLNYTTGQFRQKIEFTQHVHNSVNDLFRSLEMTSNYPIKILNISSEIKDNNEDRYLRFKVTLQNLAGGYSKPYDVVLKVPAPVNDKYFKIRNNYYVMSSQLFMKPITKTDKKEVRLISNYGVIRVGIQNLKFNPSDIEDIIRYINLKYPNLIVSNNNGQIKFSDESMIFLDGNTLYQDDKKIIFINKENQIIDSSTNEKILKGKYEVLYETILDKIKHVNPDDKLTKTKKSIPYFQIYLVSLKMPLIHYLWMQKGLKTTLHEFGVDYEEVDSPPKNAVTVPLANGRYLLLKPDTLKEELLVNGLLFQKIRRPIKNTEDCQEFSEIIAELYGPNSVRTLDIVTENYIDPITKELLEFNNLPTTLPGLAKISTDIVLNRKTDTLANLALYRARLSELILQIMYKQIKQAHSAYRTKVELGDPNAKLEIYSDYIINSLIDQSSKSIDEKTPTAGFVQNTNPVSPVEEIMLSSRLTKTGEKRTFKPEHRNIHPSQYGIVSATSTPENDKVGLVTHLTLTPLIINRYGSFGFKDINAVDTWKILGADESLIPFQNHIDSSRLTMANIHQKQITPRDNLEPPLVQTGAEYIIPQLASRRFVQRARYDGKVIHVEKNKIVKVQYDNGETESFDVLPRLSMTKRGSYIFLEMQSLGIGERFVANQPVAFTKNFNKTGIYCAGKNLTFAVINYMGMTFEDSYVMSKEIANKLTIDNIQEVSIIVPPGAEVINIRSEIGDCKAGEVLVEFIHGQSLDEYLFNFKIDVDGESEDGETITPFYSQGKDSIKLLAPEGEIVRHQILLNTKNNIDKKILMLHNDLVNNTKLLISEFERSYTLKEEKIQAIDNLDLSFMKIGKHKFKNSEFEGARIIYYIKTKRPLIVGDKIATRQGAKGVIGKLLDVPPKGEFTEKIDVFISPVGVFSRKNLVLLKELYLGKIVYYLNRKIIEMANNPNIKTSDIVGLISDVMKLICSEDVVKSIEKNLFSLQEVAMRAAIRKGRVKLYCIVRPFENVSFSNIKTAAKVLGIPLDERVYIPELNKWSDPVPVGVSYFLFLEHLSDVYASVRGAEKYIGLTGRPTKGKKRLGGQGIGNLDVNALLTYNIPSVIDELMGPKSDQHKSKRELYNQIITTGRASLEETRIEEVGGTRELLQTFIRGLGLNIEYNE